MKDFRGIEIALGDTVAYVSGGRYTDRYTAKVVGFTTKKVNIVPLQWLDKYEEKPKYYTINVYAESCWVLDRTA